MANSPQNGIPFSGFDPSCLGGRPLKWVGFLGGVRPNTQEKGEVPQDIVPKSRPKRSPQMGMDHGIHQGPLGSLFSPGQPILDTLFFDPQPNGWWFVSF